MEVEYKEMSEKKSNAEDFEPFVGDDDVDVDLEDGLIEVDKVVKKKLELVGLPDIEDKMPADLSGGMKKRVGLARALAKTPKILLYDEPTTGLDPPNINRINDLINDMNRQFNITSVIITHDIESAFAVSDRIAFLYEGEIVFIGSVDEAKNTDIKVLYNFINGVMEEEFQFA